MKITIFCLVVFTAFFNFSCRRNVESSPIAANEKPFESTSQNSAPIDFGERGIYDEMQKIGRFSNFEEDESNIRFKFQDFTIKKDVVIKSDDFDSPKTGIIDAVLSKNGKQLARFEGVYHPLGNEMNFGLFSFLGGTEKQLLVYDESLHYEHDWIVTLTPKFEVIYNNVDYDIYGSMWVLDIDNDGILELSAGKRASLGFGFSRSSELFVKIIFKYDPKSRKYLPAAHLYPEFALQGFENISFDEQLKNFKERGDRGLPEFLQIFLKYVYAGKEAEAWKFFDETEIEFKDAWVSGDKKLQTIQGKPQAKAHLKKVLQNDPIYKFLQEDLRK